jgi:hypothetical protein
VREKAPLKLEKILRSCPGERTIAAYLHRHPHLVYWSFSPLGGHDRYVLTEFPLGSRFKVDMVVINSHSGAWIVDFIELEPVNDRVFNRDRTPSRQLAIAIRQIDDWRTYVRANESQVRADLVRWAKTRDILRYSSRGKEPCNYSGDQLADPRSVIFSQFSVIIGRSTKLDAERRSLLGHYSLNHDIAVITYDRFTELATKRYGDAWRALRRKPNDRFEKDLRSHSQSSRTVASQPRR